MRSQVRIIDVIFGIWLLNPWPICMLDTMRGVAKYETVIGPPSNRSNGWRKWLPTFSWMLYWTLMLNGWVWHNFPGFPSSVDSSFGFFLIYKRGVMKTCCPLFPVSCHFYWCFLIYYRLNWNIIFHVFVEFGVWSVKWRIPWGYFSWLIRYNGNCPELWLISVTLLLLLSL